MPAQITRSQRAWIAQVNEAWEPMTRLRDGELKGSVDSLRISLHQQKARPEELTPQVVAFAKEAVRRQLGWELYDVQMLAGKAMIEGQIAEMQTGEGKTISAISAAIFGGIQGSGTHVAQPTDYLATRDFQQLKPIYESLGLSVGVLQEEQSNIERKSAYSCDITYGPGYAFGFDYLRDQVLLREVENSPLGRRTLELMKTGKDRSSMVVTRGHYYSIIDEADNVLIDDASSPLVLSEYQPGTAPDADAVALALAVARSLNPEEHYREPGPLQMQLTESGKDLVHYEELPIPIQQLCRPWVTYVETALRAVYQFHKDVHYVVADGRIKIVDATTGRIFEDRSWQSGLHQAIEAKENLDLTPEKVPIAQIARQRFYRLYSRLCGMSGTASNCKAEFRSVYELGVREIPLRIPSKRINLPMRTFATAELKWKAIGEAVAGVHARGRPVLIGTRTIAESEVIAASLDELNLGFQVLNGKQDAEEAAVVADAGQRGAITIATNLAGRGTDIKLGEGVDEMGGLHVIVSECHDSARVDRQLVGRCARQGNRGSAQVFVSADDWLLTTHGVWLADTIRKMAKDGELDLELDGQIKKIQAGVERSNYGKRLEMLKHQKERDNIWEIAAR